MRSISLVIIALTIAGCGAKGPKTVRVSGAVTLEGKPLPDVGVTFFPAKKGPVAIGSTNEKGEFTLTTTRRGDGAVLGKHKVAIGAAEEGKKIPLIAERYGSPQTTDLSAEVKSGEKNAFTFDLKPGDPPPTGKKKK